LLDNWLLVCGRIVNRASHRSLTYSSGPEKIKRSSINYLAAKTSKHLLDIQY
jgi:hypothetical protein